MNVIFDIYSEESYDTIFVNKGLYNILLNAKTYLG